MQSDLVSNHGEETDMTRTSDRTTLILGGNGKTGARVAQRLTARGLPVRLASRSAAQPFDWHDPSNWADALRGVASMYVTYFPDLAAPDASAHIRRLMSLAVDGGVQRIVLLSGRGEPQVTPSEEAVRESGLDYTILRAAWFSQNFSEGHLHGAVMSGELAFPAGDVAEPFIDIDDIADAAVAALTQPGHSGETYELTGPRLLTFAEAVAEISRASGRSIRYVPVTSAEYAVGLAEHVPADQVGWLIDLFRHVLDGHNAYVDDGVARALGREPRDFTDFARAAAAAGAWR